MKSDVVISANNKSLEFVKANIESVLRRAKELDDVIMEVSMSKIDKAEFDRMKQHVREDTNYALVAFEKLNARLNQTDRFISCYQPIEQFNRTVKCLDFVLWRKEERERLTQYYEPEQESLMDKAKVTGEDAIMNFDKKPPPVIEKPNIVVEWLYKEPPPVVEKRGRFASNWSGSSKSGRTKKAKGETMSSSK